LGCCLCGGLCCRRGQGRHADGGDAERADLVFGDVADGGRRLLLPVYLISDVVAQV